ncbi:MAG: diguanylate cyclase domain-containing protein [Desulfurivibrionaceae bacterium]
MKRILIIGDEVAAVPEIGVLLEAKRYQPIWKKVSHDAISILLDDPPDLFILEKGFSDSRDEQDLLNTVKSCQQKTNMPLLLIISENELNKEVDWQQYPVDDFLISPPEPHQLLARIELARFRIMRVFDNNPLTKLPGNTSILNAIQSALDSGDSYGVCYIDIDNFKPYNDRYGFAQGDDVILMVAKIAVNAVDELARKNGFIGHIGGDDFVFIVPEVKVKEVCEKIINNFEIVKKMFLFPEDLEKGCYVEKDRQGRETEFGLLSLSIAVVIIEGNRYNHAGEIATVSSQVKHYVKKMEGSNYMIDRRS